jgi:hypothetical protein
MDARCCKLRRFRPVAIAFTSSMPPAGARHCACYAGNPKS